MSLDSEPLSNFQTKNSHVGTFSFHTTVDIKCLIFFSFTALYRLLTQCESIIDED